jgi:hypothetical protein
MIMQFELRIKSPGLTDFQGPSRWNRLNRQHQISSAFALLLDLKIWVDKIASGWSMKRTDDLKQPIFGRGNQPNKQPSFGRGEWIN